MNRRTIVLRWAARIAVTAMLAGCCRSKPAPSGQAGARPTEPTAATPGPVPESRPSPPSGSTIECGAAQCQAPQEICCEHLAKKTKQCTPAPAVRSESELLRVCGGRDQVVASACDDSGDCPGDQLCVRPVRHGTDVSYGTLECLAPSDPAAAEAEQCGNGGACKRKGTACSKSRWTKGICTPGGK